LSQGATEREKTEQDMVCQSVGLEDFEAMIREGRLTDAMTLSAFALVRTKGLL
jgi:ADP-ribose pyrophosphatase